MAAWDGFVHRRASLVGEQTRTPACAIKRLLVGVVEVLGQKVRQILLEGRLRRQRLDVSRVYHQVADVKQAADAQEQLPAFTCEACTHWL
jgi:hypothetical protein